MRRNTAVVYWGSRGGGPRQLLNLISSIQNKDSQVLFFASSNNELLFELQTSLKKNLEITAIPKNRFQLITNIPLRNFVVKNTLANLEKNNVTRVYFLMPHPWDLYLAKKIRKLGKIEVWRGIHDIQRHPGDFWPNRLTIRRLIKNADTLVCFSSFIEKHLLKYGKPIVKSHIFEVKRENNLSSQDGSVLFVGRIKKYKGLDLLARAWPLVLNSQKSLTVAGSGAIPLELKKINANFINEWLSNSEIENLIRKSNLVVLPYIEASQSGVIAIAHSLSTPVVVTPVGGLADQVTQGINGLVASETTPESLAATIDVALSRVWEIETEYNPLPNFLVQLESI
ncbi:MAG: glycosyltransferase [Actinobacteria bacterium]|uniref:Unannotated protein n=1 Tax=freshwater metagenome TaxID=449393 RepID=A0A6J6DX68_9ZZZZ|nr:glycosyltransferase [Actinomycetota bacterium]